MARVYHPDHTARIRRRLIQMACYGLIGLLVAAVAAVIMAILDSRVVGAWRALVTVAWVGVWVVVAIAGFNLLVTLVAWALYRRRRADLDAAGAEAVGELRARVANLRRGESGD